MAVTAVSFRWLDILEKEFDKAFVDLDILLGDLDSDDPEMLFSARQKMSTLSSCFAQLTHKAQTIFQNSAKLEAELVHVRTEVVDTKTRNQALEEELHAVLVSLHTTQLQQLPGSDNLKIQNKLQQGLVERSPTHKAVISGVNMDNLVMSLENWKAQLELENESLRNTVVGLQAEVCGARLAARYLDKELAGRIQQLQLLGRSDMTGDARDRLWSQLEAEILVQRQKTVVRAVRQRDSRAPPPSLAGAVRTVRLNRHPHQGLGVSITGGREHGVPILISELEPGGGAVVAGGGGQLFVGDAVLSVNGIDLRQASHQEAVNVLSGQVGAVTLTLQYLAGNDVESDDDNDFNNLRYGFFDDANDGVDFYRTTNGYSQNNSKDRPATPTPTAPRTPDSLIRGESECSYPTSPIASHKEATNCNTDDRGTNNEESAATAERSVHISTTEPQLSAPPAVVSPKHFGVTTLQKIFRSLTPSGVWSDGTEEESNDNNETGDDEKSPTAGDNRLNLSDDVTSPEAATKSVNNINDNIEEIVLRQGGTSIVAQRMLPSNRKGVDGLPRWREQLQKESSQLFHPETEAVSLVDGHGDATFGTPV